MYLIGGNFSNKEKLNQSQIVLNAFRKSQEEKEKEKLKEKEREKLKKLVGFKSKNYFLRF